MDHVGSVQRTMIKEGVSSLPIRHNQSVKAMPGRFVAGLEPGRLSFRRSQLIQRFFFHRKICLQIDWSRCMAVLCRLCLERHSRHYLPFPIMSCDGQPLRIWIGDFRSCPAKPRTLRDIVLCAVTDCSGRRGDSRHAHIAPGISMRGITEVAYYKILKCVYTL